MAKDTAQNLISVNFRLSPEEMRQLVALGIFYGNRTRAMSAALIRLYQSTLAENGAFRELVAEGVDDDDATHTPTSSASWGGLAPDKPHNRFP